MRRTVQHFFCAPCPMRCQKLNRRWLRAFFSDFPCVASGSPYCSYCLRARSLDKSTEKCSSVWPSSAICCSDIHIHIQRNNTNDYGKSMSMPPVLTVDGPTASGKGTVAQCVAARLGFHYLDSGALYRLVALASLRRGIALDHVEALTALARTAAVSCTDGQATLESVDVSHDIRAEDVGQRASGIAAHAPVRAALIARQRAWR